MKELRNTFPLRVSECDLTGRWRPGAMMIEMQETAGDHSSAVSCGRETLVQLGLAWVVARMEVRIHRIPAYGETLTVRTFHRPHRHRFFPRFFQVTDAAGQVLAEASSLWLLMDLETRQSVNADRLPVPLPDNSDMPELIPLPGAIQPLDSEAITREYRAVYTDLDANGHVNNTKYVDWLCDTMGAEAMREHPLRQFTIHFNQEIRPEEPVTLQLRQEGTRFHMTGIHGGKNAFEISGETF